MAPPEPAPDSRPQRALISEIASRQGLVAIACLAALSALAWWWLWRTGAPGAGQLEMQDMPGMGMPAAVVAWTPAYIGGAFVMWAIMMTAMMLPSAGPMILLHDVLARRDRLGGLATAAFAASYLALWTAFAALAALAQAALVGAGVLQPAGLAFGDGRLAALLLLAAGLYELSPLKRACLSQCQSPILFLTRHWRPGVGGAVGMGLRHGAACIGCCIVLMLLLFAGGVMNLAWIALLAAVVLAEKYSPSAWRVDRILAGLLLAAAAVVFLSPSVMARI